MGCFRNGEFNPDQPHSWGWFFKLRWWSGEGCSYPLFKQSSRGCSYPVLTVPKLIVVCNWLWCHDDAGQPVDAARYLVSQLIGWGDRRKALESDHLVLTYAPTDGIKPAALDFHAPALGSLPVLGY